MTSVTPRFVEHCADSWGLHARIVFSANSETCPENEERGRYSSALLFLAIDMNPVSR
jgi:hypothetical protein